MKRFIPTVFCLLLLCAVSRCGDTYCTEMYRKDRLQTWSVISSSEICRSPAGSDASFTLVGKTLYISTGYTTNSTVDSNYWSCPNGLGGDQSIALYRHHTAGGIILRIMPPGPSSGRGNFTRDWNDGLGAYVRYTYVYSPGEIVITGTLNEYINNMLVYAFIAAAYISIFYFKSGVPATVFLTLYFLIAGLVQAIFNLSNTILYIGVTTAIILLSSWLVGMVFKMPKVHVPVCISCFVVFTLWLGLGMPYGEESYIFLFPYLIYAILIFAGYMGCIQSTDHQPLRVQMVSLGTLFGLTTFLAYYLANVYLPIPYLIIYHWQRDYVNGSNTVGLLLFFLLIIAVIVNCVLALGILCFWKTKPSSYFENGYRTEDIEGYNNPINGGQYM